MAIYDFYKSNYSQISITITSNEVLGILDTDYIEDYYGVDGQISLFHAVSNTRYSVLMTAIVPETVFRGYFQLTGKPLGSYQVQGRVRDKAGNYTVLGALSGGVVGEAVPLELNIIEGFGNGSGEGILRVQGVDPSPLIFFPKQDKPLVFTGVQKW